MTLAMSWDEWAQLDGTALAARVKAGELTPRELAKQVAAGQALAAPPSLDTPGKRALYNNLHENEALALRIDAAVREARPADWRGVQPRENAIKQALYEILRDYDEVERIFLIIEAQKEY